MSSKRKMNSRASSASSKGSKESGDNKTRMTRCFAMLTLKLTNPDYNANEVQTAYNARLETIQNQEKVCELLIRTFSGSPNEIRVRKKAAKLKKDKEMAHEAVKFLLNIIRIDQLTSDMAWKPGIPHKVQESKWKSSVKPRARGLCLIRKVFNMNRDSFKKRRQRGISESSSVSNVSIVSDDEASSLVFEK